MKVLLTGFNPLLPCEFTARQKANSEIDPRSKA